MPALYLFTGELFPTTVRNAGVGTSVMFSRMGSMIAPMVITMQDISPSLPLIVLGVAALVETALILFLPETKGMPLPETIEDLECKNDK
jgi:OCT family organic cation transporter-like MFS transporter 4/5